MTRTRSNPVRTAARFVSSVMMVSGVLLIADAGITLAWQEPISAILAKRQQHDLRRALERPPERVLRRRPLPGDAIAKIDFPRLRKSSYVVEGTQTEDLRKGPGHFEGTPLPGEHGTVAIAGHRTTYGAPFRRVDDLRRGDRVTLETPHGTYVYSVEKTQVVEPTATWVKRRVGYDRLVLSACHPLYSAAKRIVVFARFVRRSSAQVNG